MLEFLGKAILWTLAIYGVLEIIKVIIFNKICFNYKKTGINMVITVKDGEDYIEGFIRNILFKIIYSDEKFVNEILIIDLYSTDKTKEILEKLETDYECIKVIDMKDYKELIDSLDT